MGQTSHLGGGSWPLCVKGGQRAGTCLKLQGHHSQPAWLAVWKVDLPEPVRAGPRVVGRGFPACHWPVALAGVQTALVRVMDTARPWRGR